MANQVGLIMNSNKIGLEITKLDLDKIPEDVLYVGVAGFEDRSLEFLKKSIENDKKFKSCFGIYYQPLDENNRKDEFNNYAEEIFSKIIWAEYNRYSPEEFTETVNKILDMSKHFSQIVIDISGMSKMLIIVLLHGLKELIVPIRIIYARAGLYHPIRKEFERVKAQDQTNKFPYFLTSHVYEVLTTNELSSISMQGAPILLIAFPNFNYLEVAALLNTMNPQKLFLIESINELSKNAWRLDAIRWLNSELEKYISPTKYEIDASELDLTINILEEIYSKWHLTHKIILSPTGGKLQTVASLFFKIIHPDVHIIYPVVKRFDQEYTEGARDHYEILIENFHEFTKKLSSIRTARLDDFL